jgi:hypothetical protein
MHKLLLLGAVALPLAGCGVVPPAVSIASLVLDVGSVAVSGKTVTDHGLSAMAEQDCALIRVLTEGEACREPQHYETTLAALEPLPEAGRGEQADAMQVPAEFAYLETAAPGVVSDGHERPVMAFVPALSVETAHGTEGLLARQGYLASGVRVGEHSDPFTQLAYLSDDAVVAHGAARGALRDVAVQFSDAAPARKPAGLGLDG